MIPLLAPATVVAMTISILLLLLAVPGYTVWVADNEIRNAAESVSSGLRFAQTTAITRNANAQFVLSPADWNVMLVDAPLVPIKTATFAEGSRHATVTGMDLAFAAATTVAFNPLGQVINAATNVVRIDITQPGVAGTRQLRVLVGNGRTGVKMCDPAFLPTDPKGCP